jgi:hypothetical protein
MATLMVCVVPAAAQRSAEPLVPGLDHIPIAVQRLGEAARRYQALGFTLKPGRPHANGIQNLHAKFADGTELELITAPAARDDLSAHYRAHLQQGDGPAFLALYAPAVGRLSARLQESSFPHRISGSMVLFDERAALPYLFFGPRNHSPTDRPEHFAHANTAESLIAVWLAGADLGSERRLLAALGATIRAAEVNIPAREYQQVATLPEGEVILLPGRHQRVPGRRVVGATLRVRSLEAARRVLAAAQLPVPATVQIGTARSIFLPPELTHGIWLELREVQ